MSDVKIIQIDNASYNINDATARNSINGLKPTSFSTCVHCNPNNEYVAFNVPFGCGSCKVTKFSCLGAGNFTVDITCAISNGIAYCTITDSSLLSNIRAYTTIAEVIVTY